MGSGIAFVGFGQGVPSHLWMKRMLDYLEDDVVIAIDGVGHQLDATSSHPNQALMPQKPSRLRRLRGHLGLASPARKNFQNEWMQKTLNASDASLVLVHFLTYAIEFSKTWESLDIPVVIHCHGYDVSWDLRTPDGSAPVHDASYVQRVQDLPCNTFFIANSTWTRSRLMDIGIASQRIFLKRFGVSHSDTPRTYQPQPNPKVLYLGRLVDFKGPLETVRAFHQCAKWQRDASLTIAGDGALLEPMQDLLNTLGLERRTDQLGAVDANRAHELRRAAAIFTAHNQIGPYTLQEEAFGVSLLEAMACGLPVVTGRSGGIPDFIESGDNGILFDPGDIEGHATILDELLASPQKCQAIGTAAWETVRDRFKPEDERSDLRAIFDAVRSGALPESVHVPWSAFQADRLGQDTTAEKRAA